MKNKLQPFKPDSHRTLHVWWTATTASILRSQSSKSMPTGTLAHVCWGCEQGCSCLFLAMKNSVYNPLLPSLAYMCGCVRREVLKSQWLQGFDNLRLFLQHLHPGHCIKMQAYKPYKVGDHCAPHTSGVHPPHHCCVRPPRVVNWHMQTACMLGT